MTIRTKIIQYGFQNSIKRGMLFLIRMIGVYYESYYLLKNNINIEVLNHKMEQYDYNDVKALTIEDFAKGDPDVFTCSKLSLISKRLQNPSYIPYGILIKDTLVYSGWINTEKIIFSSNFSKSISLQLDEGVLEDQYCHPNFRGKGYHSKMNLHSLNKLYELGKYKAFVVVLCQNTPAIKTQLKSDFSLKYKMSFLKLWGKQYSFKKKI